MSNRRNIRLFAIVVILLVNCLTAVAQQFYNLTADEVRIDSVLPRFTCSIPLQGQYADSVYTVRILYPEFVPMTPYSERRLMRLTSQPLPEMPEVESRIVVERRKASLEVLFVPLVRWRLSPVVRRQCSVHRRPLTSAMPTIRCSPQGDGRRSAYLPQASTSSPMPWSSRLDSAT